MLKLMNKHSISAIGQFTLKVGGIAIGLVVALLGTFRELFSSADTSSDRERSLQDSDLIGDYNFRTQQFDSGTDPAGWYEDEP
jgi:hypothetical protein